MDGQTCYRNLMVCFKEGERDEFERKVVNTFHGRVVKQDSAFGYTNVSYVFKPPLVEGEVQGLVSLIFDKGISSFRFFTPVPYGGKTEQVGSTRAAGRLPRVSQGSAV